MIALGDNDPKWEEEYNALGTAEHTTIGKRAKTRRNYDPRSGSGTRLDPIAGGRRLANYLTAMTLEAQTIARACGKAYRI